MMSVLPPGIYIEGLSIDCHIGPAEDERAIEQRILVSLFLHLDLNAAGAADDLELTVNYRTVSEVAIAQAMAAPVRTIERLGFDICRKVLQTFPLLQAVTAEIHKPGVPGRAERVTASLTVHAQSAS